VCLFCNLCKCILLFFSSVPSLNMAVRRLKVSILPLDLPCSYQTTRHQILDGSNLLFIIRNWTLMVYCWKCKRCGMKSQSTKRESNPITGLDRPWGFQKVEASRLHGSRPMKVVKLAALRTGRLYTQEIFLALIYVRGWVDPRAKVRPERICQWKIAITPSGIEPATLQLVAQWFGRLYDQI